MRSRKLRIVGDGRGLPRISWWSKDRKSEGLVQDASSVWLVGSWVG